MRYWKEAKRKEPIYVSTLSSNRRHAACIQYPDPAKSEDNFTIFGRKWTEPDEPRAIDEWPQGWVELWPDPPVVASNFTEARQLQLSFLTQMETESSPDNATIKGLGIELVEILEDVTKKFCARIYRIAEDRYEVKFFSYSRGRGILQWLPLRTDKNTYAIDLDSARIGAKRELEQLKPELST